MKTKEEKKLINLFKQIIIWTLFICMTAAGLIFAGARTRYIDEKTEYETVTSLRDIFFTE